jgi:hypothetical protein
MPRGHHHHGTKFAAKVHKVMHEFKHHKLHSGSKHGPLVTSSKQAIAIGLNKARKASHIRQRR